MVKQELDQESDTGRDARDIQPATSQCGVFNVGTVLLQVFEKLRVVLGMFFNEVVDGSKQGFGFGEVVHGVFLARGCVHKISFLKVTNVSSTTTLACH